ncbi:MAG: MJ0042-type zinc finger domain-containing protein [Gemmataceae bacterium]
MSVRDVPCPNCHKSIRVTDELTGKRVKCKACATVFTVPAADDGAKPLPDEFKKPTAKPAQPKKPAKAKPRVVDDDPPPPPPPAAPLAFLDEDDGPKDYKVAKDDLDIPRCPRCAKELEDADARICLNCGYDMMQRRQHASIKTYKRTGGDVFMWWLPAIIWFGVLMGFLGVFIWMCINLGTFMRENEILVGDEENQLTGKKGFALNLEPMFFDVCCGLFILALAAFGVPVIWRRLKSPKPAEVEKKK